MKTLELTSKIFEYEREELPHEVAMLLAKAEDAAKRAYSPYSPFRWAPPYC